MKKTNTVEVVISFLKDSTFEEEFFLVIESKDFNPETGVKDKRLIPIDDIDEIEHISGTEFEVRYETEVKEPQALAPIKQALLSKVNEKLNKKSALVAKKQEKVEKFDSKFVKNIIETFNNVLILIDNQE